MRISDLIKMCLGNIFRRKVRTALTAIGVVVGTCSIVVMMSMGIGMSKQFEDSIKDMADLTVIEVFDFNNNNNGKKALNDVALKNIEEFEGVQVVAPILDVQDAKMQLFTGPNNRYECEGYNIKGINPETLELLGFKINEGRFLKKGDKEYSVIIGQYAAYNFRDTRKKPPNDRININPYNEGVEIEKPFFDPFKQPIYLKIDAQKQNAKPISKKLNVIGSLKADMSKGYEFSTGIFMSIDDFKKLILEYKRENGIRTSNDIRYTNVRVKVVDINYVEGVEKKIKELGFETNSMETIRDSMKKSATRIQLVLGGIGAISLFVAALGITNTMIMSIYERTREIGVMKVLGCFVNNIRSIFLIEAGLIGFMGGVLGIIISCLISYIINTVSSAYMSNTKISVIPIWLYAAAILFSTLIGVIAGFYPSNRACKISALEAIKQE